MKIPPGFHHCDRHCGKTVGFTLVELLCVMTIIAILAALVLGTFQYAQQKGARSRSETEINALEAALESYKADNGTYPSSSETDSLGPVATSYSPSAYVAAGQILYKALSGDTDFNFSNGMGGASAGKQYFEFKPNQLYSNGTTSTTYPIDPWGNAYGYSTAQANVAPTALPATTPGFNPTFDLWSTAGSTEAPNPTPSSGTVDPKWIKNW